MRMLYANIPQKDPAGVISSGQYVISIQRVMYTWFGAVTLDLAIIRS
jgi:hypothetical protein